LMESKTLVPAPVQSSSAISCLLVPAQSSAVGAVEASLLWCALFKSPLGDEKRIGEMSAMGGKRTRQLAEYSLGSRKSGRFGKQQARELTAHQPTRPDRPSKGKLDRLVTYVGAKRWTRKGYFEMNYHSTVRGAYDPRPRAAHSGDVL
jgi:hypothetical protein